MKEAIRAIHNLSQSIGRQVKLMEVCGTHTMAIFRHGIRSLLPKEISLLSGPGCPVCVTSIKDIDTAIAISRLTGVALTTFGDMMRVPGTKNSLYASKAEGADIRVVYSPLDALEMARNSSRKIVFFAAGFETTSPLVAATIAQAEKEGIGNFYVHTAHKTVPPALNALLDCPEVKLDGFILPGHVSAIIGSRPYEFVARQYNMPSVIAGFDAPDIANAIVMLLGQINSGKASVEIQYRKVVREEGNPKAIALINEYFEPSDARWRGIGIIPQSALRLREKFMHRDAERVFDISVQEHPEPKGCLCGRVLRGLSLPTECPLFGKICTPEAPVGACMVSVEGSCAVYYKYGGVKIG